MKEYRFKAMPSGRTFGVVNDSLRILLLIDEAHRTQGSDLGDNIFEAFPNAVRIAFTGTQLITERHGEKKTRKRFGQYIETYRLMDAVNDGATLQILYEGKTADAALNDKAGFETAFEDLFKDRSEEELLAIKKKYGASGDILEAEQRIKAIAVDIEVIAGRQSGEEGMSKEATTFYAHIANAAFADGKVPPGARATMKARRIRDIDYQLLPGTNRKTTDIVIERNGIIAVRPPRALSPEEVDAVVESKRMWIYKNLARWCDMNATSVVREWVNGETFLYLGRAYRLSLVGTQELDLKLKEGRFCLKRSLIEEGGGDAARRAFEDFYSAKGKKRLRQRVAHFAPKVGLAPAGIVVKDLGYRWASCTRQRTLVFHWKCMMAPPRIIDSMVVHELCHLRHRNHSDAFWNEVDKVMPDYRERKMWLKRQGAGLDL